MAKMEGDALRPALETRKSVFANGFRFWHSLHVTAIDDNSPVSISIENIKAAIHNHPHFPKGLDLKEEHGCAVARGISTWNTSYGPCELPSFERQLDFTSYSRRPKHIHLKSSSRPLQVGEERWSQWPSNCALPCMGVSPLRAVERSYAWRSDFVQ